MADIKRLNYFTYQFLVEKDFDDEQDYHLQMRRRHNRAMHTAGVASGLEITRTGPSQVRIAPGTAIDRDGREIVIDDARTYSLLTGGNNQDVFLTIAYHEEFDPADHSTEGGANDFRRTTERPLVQDTATAPPADGTVILLAKIHLNAESKIDSDAAIDATVRTLVSAKVGPKAVTTAQLADGAVTLEKLATAVQPLAVQGTNSVTVVTDNAAKKITVGESHSARIDNPHATTAAQIDAQGGANRIVTQINAGSGVIARARVESAMATGVVTFQNLLPSVEAFSNDIDPGFGAGPLRVDLALDDVPAANATLAGDPSFGRTIQYRTVVNRANGTFRIFAMRAPSTAAGLARIRWYAFKPVAGADSSVTVDVTVNPPSANLAGNTPLNLTASVSNVSNAGVSWSAPDGGTLSALTANSATWTSPTVSNPAYRVIATSVADTSKSKTVTIGVVAEIFVQMSQQTANLLNNGGSINLSATVFNTADKGVAWKIEPAGMGTLVPSGVSALYTAPTTPGAYVVRATSTADASKSATCTITVAAVSIGVSADATQININTSTTVRATITPGFADNRATWSASGGGSISTGGPSTSTTFFAPSSNGVTTIRGTSVADPNKSQQVSISVVGEPPPPPPPPPGKFISDEIQQSLVPEDAKIRTATKASTPGKTDGKARTFLKPQKRPSTKPPEEPGK
jgi:hypothetical protein